MKLSKQFAEMAEWWLIDISEWNQENDNKLWHIDAGKFTKKLVMPDPNLSSEQESNEARAYLCLLESEYQKDLEEL
jgi:hypothetical protein